MPGCVRSATKLLSISSKRIPRLAVTAGEPAGIGPDILLNCAAQGHGIAAEIIAIADPQLLAQRAAALNINIELHEFDPTQAATAHVDGRLKYLPVTLAKPCVPGQLNAANAAYVLETLQLALDGCLSAQFDAMVTAPVQKSIINDAGIPFSGHTEFLAEASDTDDVVMMLATADLRVALATTHLPLAEVPSAITAHGLVQTIVILHRDLIQKFGINHPRIAVLGLNPHAGEGGHLGREEVDTIIPTLERLRTQGMDLLGPLPADTAFNPKVLKQVDAVLAMYHDQGLPVLKYSGFGEAINITLGLPIIRTSVDHGTALDLAGSGEASATSLRRAMESAVAMCEAQASRDTLN
jgi:4-hydroxythreonine-4-phosphate dehydrogenase